MSYCGMCEKRGTWVNDICPVCEEELYRRQQEDEQERAEMEYARRMQEHYEEAQGDTGKNP